MSNKKSATLYVVATPIGNLKDITLRALEVLKEVDFILAEDTRNTAKLLSQFGISKKLVSYHHHNERARISQIETHLLDGKSIALVSDAGTPLISDPGYVIVNHLRDKDFDVVPVPGVSAIITALSAAGLSTDKFQFIGFLSSKEKMKEKELQNIESYPGVSVIYESPHRLISTLKTVKNVLGLERKLVLCKELTKQYESFVLGSADDVLKWLESDPLRLKGEFVLLIDRVLDDVSDDNEGFGQIDHMLEVLLDELPLKQSVAITSKILNVKKNKVYERALYLSKEKE